VVEGYLVEDGRIALLATFKANPIASGGAIREFEEQRQTGH
jgi:hypothetical protein